MGQPLGVVLVFMVETESWHVHLPGHGEKGKETRSRMSHCQTNEASITLSTLLFLHGELGLDKAVPKFRREVLGQRWDHMVGSSVPQSSFVEDGIAFSSVEWIE